jgi:hypothetical protein
MGRRRGSHYTPEQRANVSRGVKRWHEQMTREKQEEWRQSLRIGALFGGGDRCGRPNLTEGHSVRVPKDAIEQRSLTRRYTASVRGTLKEIWVEHNADVKQAIIDGILAGPPVSALYIKMLLAAEEAGLIMPESAPSWAQFLTDEQLSQVGRWIAEAKERAAKDEGVIDVTAERNE